MRCGGKLFLSKPGICQLSTTTKDPENKIRRDWKAHFSAKLDQRTGSKDSNAFCDEERKTSDSSGLSRNLYALLLSGYFV